MADTKKGQPTGLRPIFVASGQGADNAAEFALAALDFVFSNERMELPASVKGDISGWIQDLFEKPDELRPRAVPEHSPNAAQREVLREAATGLADPRSKEEMYVAALVGEVSLEDMERLAAIQNRNVATINKVRSDMYRRMDEKLSTQISPEVVQALLALTARSRAGRAAVLCMTLYKIHPLTLIAAAQKGDREAVLKLVKIDKLFLTDPCTAGVIRTAELQQDGGFLKQLARAITYTPKIGWRHGCRMYLYGLLSSGVSLPASTKLRLRLDPSGTRFKGLTGFEKFVERSRRELRQMEAPPATDNLKKKQHDP